MLMFCVPMACGLTDIYHSLRVTYSFHLRATCSSEMLVQCYKSIWYYNTENQHQHLHCHENLKFHTWIVLSITSTQKSSKIQGYFLPSPWFTARCRWCNQRVLLGMNQGYENSDGDAQYIRNDRSAWDTAHCTNRSNTIFFSINCFLLFKRF
jgi:hypothetical protein